MTTDDNQPDIMSTVRALLDGEHIECREYPRRDFVAIRVVEREAPGRMRAAAVLVNDYSLDLLIDYLQQARHRMRMTPYVQREIFRPQDVRLFKRAESAVAGVGAQWGNELRCHELTRAVHRFLDDTGLEVVDGRLGPVEHSWLEYMVPIDDTARGSYPSYQHFRRVILDVYAPGRIPQVQMIHRSPAVVSVGAYVPTERRTDINERIVTLVHAEIKRAAERTKDAAQ